MKGAVRIGAGLPVAGIASLLAVAAIASLLAGPLMARNLPKAEPSPKVVPCDAMGPGFVRVEGSDTCVKLGGSVRVEFEKQSGDGATGPGVR